MSDYLSALHGATVHRRRVRRLATLLAELLPPDACVLDVGCGDGQLGALLIHLRPDLTLEGVDVLVRSQTLIPVRWYDGQTLPVASKAVDVVLLVDVLHHCDDPQALMRDCDRVARQAILIKDHLADGMFAAPLLRFMDWVGNAGHGVALPYNYWRLPQWHDAWTRLGWTIRSWKQDLALYPNPADWIFGRDLHFLAELAPRSAADGAP